MSFVRILLIGVPAMLLFGATVQSAEAPATQTFEDGVGAWTTMGPKAGLSITHEPANVKSGKSALAYAYEVGKDGLSLAALPLAPGSVESMRGVAFWMKTDSPAPIAVLLSEAQPGGGNYSAVVWSSGGHWQRVELTLSDFLLNDSPTDPKDADGKLDPGQVQAIGFLDLSQIFERMQRSPDFPLYVAPRAGSHTLFLDDVEVLKQARPATAQAPGVPLDTFDREQLSWFTLGGVELNWARRGMEARYDQDPEHFFVISRMLPPVDMRKMARLAFDISSQWPATLILGLQEQRTADGKEGARYNVTIEVSGGGRKEHRAVSFEAFNLDPNGPADSNGKLDLNAVKSISIVDIRAAESRQGRGNVLWIGDLRAIPE